MQSPEILTASDKQTIGRTLETVTNSSDSGPFFPDSPHHDITATALAWTGRFFLGISLLAFGTQEFRYSGFIGDLGLVPDWAPAHLVCAWLAGAILLLAGLSILTGNARGSNWSHKSHTLVVQRVRPAAEAGLMSLTEVKAPNRRPVLVTTLLGFVFLLSAFLRFTTHIPGMIHNIGDRGVFFELLACCAGSWMVARTFSLSGSGSAFGGGSSIVSNALSARLATAARWLFGIAFIVFGSLHLQAPAWIAGLIPHWIPFPLFFAWFTGCALIAAGLAIAIGVWTRLSASLLALMLFSWVLIVHAPRIAHALHDGDEWNSGFVCLTMAGSALLAAALASRSRPETATLPSGGS
ncbi:MAG: DoxX family membrane protein [Acidobacteriaceae bacterium]